MSRSGARGKKLYEEIVDQLLTRIQEGSLKPGDRLPAERMLAEELGVSRTAIREALRSMEMLGCVESRVGEGTYIKAPSISDIVDPFSMTIEADGKLDNELIEARMILETEIAALAAKRRSREQLDELARALGDMEYEIHAGRDGVEADERFHTILAQAAGNDALNTILGMCADMLSRTRRITQRIKGVPMQALEQHREIFEAVTMGDEGKARRRMRRHLARAQQNLNKVK